MREKKKYALVILYEDFTNEMYDLLDRANIKPDTLEFDGMMHLLDLAEKHAYLAELNGNMTPVKDKGGAYNCTADPEGWYDPADEFDPADEDDTDDEYDPVDECDDCPAGCNYCGKYDKEWDEFDDDEDSDEDGDEDDEPVSYDPKSIEEVYERDDAWFEAVNLRDLSFEDLSDRYLLLAVDDPNGEVKLVTKTVSEYLVQYVGQSSTCSWVSAGDQIKYERMLYFKDVETGKLHEINSKDVGKTVQIDVIRFEGLDGDD